MPFNVRGIIGRIALDDVPYLHLRAEPDGNCLFHAAGFLLERQGLLKGDDGDHAKLRAKVIGWIERVLGEGLANEELYTPVATHILTLDGADVPESPLVQKEVLKAYLDKMARDKTWGDTLCVHALERLYGVSIRVHGLPGKALLNVPSVGAHTLRLVCPAALDPAKKLVSGASCHNHFDALVLESERATLPGAVTAVPGPPRARLPWSYWLHGKGLELYGPAVCHSQFTAGAPQAVVKKAISSAFSSDVSVDLARPSSRVHLVHRLEKAPPLYSDAYAANGKDDAFRPAFLVPLLRASGLVTQAPNLAVLQLLFAIKGSKKSHACFRVHSRKSRDQPVLEVRLSLEALAKLEKKVDVPGPEGLYEGFEPHLLDLSDVIPAEDWKKLTWENSPYRLTLAPSGADDAPDAEALFATYFQVPSRWDVDVIEAYGNERVLLLGDTLAGLEGLQGAAMEQRTPLTEAPISLTPKEQQTISLAMKGLGGKQTNFSKHITSAFFERDKGRFFAATSWASMIVLQRAKDKSGYYAHSLYYLGEERSLYALGKKGSAVASGLQEMQARLDEIAKLTTAARRGAVEETSAVGTAEGDVRTAQQKLVPIDANITKFNEMLVDLRKDAVKNQQFITVYEKAIAEENQRRVAPAREVARLEAIVQNKVKARDLKKAKIEQSIKPLTDEQASIEKKIALSRGSLEELSTKRSPSARIEGSGDFDYDARESGWQQIVFEPGEFPLTHAVTMGISSCAGGVTFTAGADPPDVILFWHIDAPPSVPVKTAIEQLWPNIEDCPALRTIVSVHPSVWELNKYRKDMLYPEAIQARCETVHLARGKNLHDSASAVVSGSDYFGLDLTNPDSVSLVFTNDFDKRTIIEKNVDKETAAGLSIGLLDFKANLYGDYRLEDQAIETPEALKVYLDKIHGSEKTMAPIVADKAKHGKVCRLAGLGAGLFDALAKAPSCHPVLDLPCFALGEKGEQEIARMPVNSHYSWVPGPLVAPSDESNAPSGLEKPPVVKPLLLKKEESPPPLVQDRRALHCVNCNALGVRVRCDCQSGCANDGVMLCGSCAARANQPQCLGCMQLVRLWDMDHDTAWQ